MSSIAEDPVFATRPSSGVERRAASGGHGALATRALDARGVAP